MTLGEKLRKIIELDRNEKYAKELAYIEEIKQKITDEINAGRRPGVIELKIDVPRILKRKLVLWAEENDLCLFPKDSKSFTLRPKIN